MSLLSLTSTAAVPATAAARPLPSISQNRKYGGHDDKNYKPEEKEYEHKPRHDKPYKPEHKDYEHEKPEYEPEEKPEWPVKVVKAPHLLNCADMTLEIDSPEWTATGQAIGSVGVLR